VYTLTVTGAALDVLAECLILRRDGVLVSMRYVTGEDNSTALLPVMQPQDKVAGWRAKLAYRLLGL
jgi:hypothetical protein